MGLGRGTAGTAVTAGTFGGTTGGTTGTGGLTIGPAAQVAAHFNRIWANLAHIASVTKAPLQSM